MGFNNTVCMGTLLEWANAIISPELLIEIGVSIVQSGPADESMMVATPRSHKIAWQGHKIVKDGGGSPGKSSSRPDVPITCPRSFTPLPS
jgi:hypothetical protein